MIYDIFLDHNKIGTTILDKADAPMGCVSGKITFADKPLSYDVISKYCKDNNIIAIEHPEDKAISTQTIPTLSVINENGIEIKGACCYLEGMEYEGYEIVIIGIPYPFYGEEFPHHVKEYRKL